MKACPKCWLEVERARWEAVQAALGGSRPHFEGLHSIKGKVRRLDPKDWQQSFLLFL